jgi:broad specificity phosphatase PhoE
MSSSTIISFIRHGHVHNPQRILYGRLPRFGLSDKGRVQAQTVARALGDKPIAALYSSPISALYSSPMLRARQTARAILDVRPGLVLHVSGLLNEVHTSSQGKPLLELMMSGWDLYTGSGYEQPQDVLDRALRFIDRTRKRHAGQHVVAVSHGDVIAFIIRWAKRLSIGPHHRELLLNAGIPEGYPAPASISTLAFQTANRDDRPEFAYHAPFQEHAE